MSLPPQLPSGDPPSPCTKVCRMAHGFCAGCGRTLDEIARWREMSADEKLAVLRRVAAMNEASSKPWTP